MSVKGRPVPGPDTRPPTSRWQRAPYVEGLGARHVVDLAVVDLDAEDETFQYRLEADAADLVRSLALEGQREPIDVIGSRPYRIVDGYRRVDAVRELGWPIVKAFVHRDLSEDQAHGLAFVKNVVRRNLSPLEKAHAIHLAQERGRTRADVARSLGLSEKQIDRYLALLAFPEAVRRLLETRAISMAQAKVLADAAAGDPVSWARKAASAGWSAGRLGTEIARVSGRKRRGRKRVYLRKDKDVLRIYAFQVSRHAPRGERKRVIELLREAIDFLEQDG